VLENELAHILDERDDIEKIYLRRSSENRRFGELLLKKDVIYINDPCHLRINTSERSVYVDIVPAALHTDLYELEYQCHERVDDVKGYCNLILFFFGLCGNALKTVFAREDVNILCIKDEYDGIVDDCIVATMGRDTYMSSLQEMNNFFLTNGWIEHWESIIMKLEGPKEDGMFKELLRANDYKKTLFIRQKNVDSSTAIDGARTISRNLGLGYDSIEGKMDLLERAIDQGISASGNKKKYLKRKREP